MDYGRCEPGGQHEKPRTTEIAEQCDSRAEGPSVNSCSGHTHGDSVPTSLIESPNVTSRLPECTKVMQGLSSAKIVRVSWHWG
jgi:hypothetical protein